MRATACEERVRAVLQAEERAFAAATANAREAAAERERLGSQLSRLREEVCSRRGAKRCASEKSTDAFCSKPSESSQKPSDSQPALSVATLAAHLIDL